MSSTTSGLALYKSQKEYFLRNEMNALQGHQVLAHEGEADLKRLLSGTLTPKQTRGAFARGGSPALSTPTGRRRELTARQRKNRALKGSVPLNPINVQSGRLLAGVALRRRATGMRLQEMDLDIDGVDYAHFVLAIGGTRYAVGRNVQAELKRTFGPRNKAFIDHFVRNSRP